MKTKRFEKKFKLNKATVTNLNTVVQAKVKGGYWQTNLPATCGTYCGPCATNFPNCTGIDTKCFIIDR